MAFGLKNAPPTSQRVMDNISRGLQNIIGFVCHDDIITFSTSLEKHIERLKLVPEKLVQ